MKILVCALLLVLVQGAIAQQRIAIGRDDINLQTGSLFQEFQGKPFNSTSFIKPVEGTRFFKDDWMKGAAVVSKEKEYTNVFLKIDLLGNDLLFKDEKGVEMICTTPLQSVRLTDHAIGREYRFIHTSSLPDVQEFPESGWLEVLADGKASLFCQHKKKLSETRPYGSATLEQRIYTTDVYYLFVDNRLVKVRKMQDLVAALPGKSIELQQWLGSTKEKSDRSFTALVSFYNSLFN